MRLADMRWWARFRLLDQEKRVFPEDGPIDTALNIGAYQVQKAVQACAPDAFRRHYYRNLVAGISRYQAPKGMIRPKQLFVKYDGTSEVELLPGMERMILLDQYGDCRYNVTGGEFVIGPTPTKNVEDGFHLLYVPTLAMADDDDDLESFGLVQPLHMAVVLWAVKLLLPAGGESNKDIDAEIASLQSDIPTLYAHSDLQHPILVEGLGLELS